jgi:hypothetical protein
MVLLLTLLDGMLMLLSGPALHLSLSLSLSHTHTHTHTQTLSLVHFQDRLYISGSAVRALPPLSDATIFAMRPPPGVDQMCGPNVWTKCVDQM